MFPLRSRWTLLTAIIAGIGYFIRNYDIQGLEDIRFEPRDPTAQVEPVPPIDPFPQLPVSFPKSPSSLPGTNPNSRPVIAPSPIPSALPGSLPSTLPSTSVSRLPGVAATTFPNSFLETDVNPGQSISLGEKFAVWEASQIPSSSGETAGSSLKSGDVPSQDKTIRIASFNVQVFGSAKRAKPHVMEMLVKLLRQFEVVALQEIRTSQDDLLPELVDRINQSGRHFDYVIGPRVGRGTSREQFAFLFDAERIETDRYQLYTVDDPHDLLYYEPLVGWFRTKGIPVSEAFTFSLINIHSHPDFAQQENQSLPDLIRAIERDGRNEDDWIFAGNFGASDSQLAFLQNSGARFALQGVPTDTRGLEMLDNLIFSNQGTREYTGRTGVVDFLRQFNLSLEQALEVSDQLPIWSEFTIHEGGLPGRVAPQVAPTNATPDFGPSFPNVPSTIPFNSR